MESLKRFMVRRKSSSRSEELTEEGKSSEPSSSSSSSSSLRTSMNLTSREISFGSSQSSNSAGCSVQSPTLKLDSSSRMSSTSRSSCASGFSGRSECTMTIRGNAHQFPLALVGDNVLYGSNQVQVKVINCSTAGSSTSVTSFSGSNAPVKSLIIHEETVFTAHEDLKIRVWKTRMQHSQHKLVATLPTTLDRITTYVLPNSHVRTRRHKQELRIQHYDAIAALAMSCCGTILYSGSWDRTVKVWRLSDFKCIDSFEAHSDAINALVSSKDGHLYSGSADCKVKVWERSPAKGNSNTHFLTAAFHEHKAGVNALALSWDEHLLFSASGDKQIIVWEREGTANHMNMSGVLKGHTGAVLCLAASTIDDVLCSGSADKSIRVWKRVDGGTQHCCLAVLEGHKGAVKSLSMSTSTCEGLKLYSSGLDGSLKTWWVSLASESKEEEEQ